MTDKTEIQSTEQITQDPEELTLAALKKIQELEAEKEAINAQSSAIGTTTTKPKAGG